MRIINILDRLDSLLEEHSEYTELQILVDDIKDELENPPKSLLDVSDEDMDEFISSYGKKLETKENVKQKYINIINSFTDEEFEEKFHKFLIWEEKYEEMCYQRHVLSNSNIWDFVFDTSVEHGKELDIYEDFLGGAYEYRGYIFKIFHGQGCFFRIEKDDKIIFQST